MISVSENDVLKYVAESLQHRLPLGRHLSVPADGVRHEQDWWFVPVVVEESLPKTDDYYDLLSDVEDDIRQNHKLNVTLVPRDDIAMLSPMNGRLKPLYVRGADWMALCRAANVTANRQRLNPSECAAIAASLKQNPTIIPLDPPTWAQELIFFFENCNGLELR